MFTGKDNTIDKVVGLEVGAVDCITKPFDERELLASLLARPMQALSRQEILDLVFGRDWSPIDRSIDMLVAKLRRKLEQDPKYPRIIKTVRGMGYMFAAEVEIL